MNSTLFSSISVPLILRNNLSVTACQQHLASSSSVFAFPEIIGLDEARFVEAAQWATHLVSSEAESDPIWQIGLSPHAPYSIHFPTAEKELASRFTRQLVTAMHVAESLDERQWLESGSGPFREVFERLGIPADAPRASLTHVIRWLATRHRGLLVHGNYLNEAETELVAGSALSIVYCPRTHRHFGHTEYPLQRFSDSQINVVLGTDSRASNPDLDLWSEVIALRESHAWVSPEWAYGAVTQRSAAALGVDQHFGSLLPGRVASINVSSFDSTVPPIELLDELTTRTRPFTPLTDLLASLHQH
jgi:cytosine/adenosine deaminase-related metal-dependent hydrolase